MDMAVETEDENLPSEYRILRWDDGFHSFHKVYLKDGKPFRYEEEGLPFGADTSDELDAVLAEIGTGIAQASVNPVLSEADDFPGQYRMPPDSMSNWLKRQNEFLIQKSTSDAD